MGAQAASTATHVPIAVLVLGTADWQQPIATNQHYITRELSRASDVSVTFVESLALRAPEFTRRDVARIATRVKSAVRASSKRPSPEPRPIPDGTTVVSPLVAPAAWRWSHGINTPLLRRSVSAWLAHTGPRVLWTYSPVTYGLERRAHMTVYHCVDLLGRFEGINAPMIDRHEANLARSGAIAAATSKVVHSHLVQRGFALPLLWENVADTEVFSAAVDLARPRSPRRAIFAGNLTPKKVDYSALVTLARSGWDVVVAGPRAQGGGNDEHQFDQLIRAGITYLGMLSPRDLAAEMARATLGLIPYLDTAYTRGVSPLKTFEYLAAGLPVISSELPGVTPVPGMIETVSDHAALVERAEQYAATPTVNEVNSRRAHAAQHSWERRGAEAREIVATVMGFAAHEESAT